MIIATMLEKKFKPNHHIVSRHILEETLLIPIQGQMADLRRIFSLNPVAAFIWEHLDGKTTLAAILTMIPEEFDIDESTAKTDLLEFIETLYLQRVIVEAE